MGDGKLKRDLSLYQVIAMAAGGMIAAWMVEITYWFELSGPGSFWALLVTGIFVIPLGLAFSELNAMLPFAGGANVWASNAFNWDVGWYLSWASYLLYILAMPTVVYGLITMSSYFAPLSFEQIKMLGLIILLIWFVVSNFRVRILGWVQSLMFTIMVIASIYVSANFILDAQWSFETLKPWLPNGWPGFGAAVAILVFKYIGFDMIPQLSEEANYPIKDQWKAYVGAVAATFLVYGLAILGNAGIVSNEWIINADIVDPRVADLIGKHYLAIIIVVTGILGTLTTLTGFWLSAARILYGASRQRQLAEGFSRLNKHGQPWIANIFVGIFSIYFTIFAPEQWVEYIYTIYSFTAGIVYLMIALSYIVLRHKRPEWNRPYKAPGGLFTGYLAVAFCLWIIIGSLSEIAPYSLLVLGGYYLIGIASHLYAKRMQKVKPDEWAPHILTPDDL